MPWPLNSGVQQALFQARKGSNIKKIIGLSFEFWTERLINGKGFMGKMSFVASPFP